MDLDHKIVLGIFAVLVLVGFFYPQSGKATAKPQIINLTR